MRWNKKSPVKSDKTQTVRSQKRGIVGYSKKSALLEEAITQMNAGKYARSSAVLKELLALDPGNMEARRLFATLHLRLGSLIPARQAFDSLIDEAFQRQDYWLAESLLREYLTAAQRCVPYLEKLGRIYEEKGDILEAVTEYGKAVDILVEDPDTENSQQASQLYKKIRDLAPVSPVAFRLASFFDAQTGDLLARQPTGDPESTLTSEADSTAAALAGPVHVEPITDPLPWELPNPQEVTSSSGSAPLPSHPTASEEVSWEEELSTQDQTVLVDTQYSPSREEQTRNVQNEMSAETHNQEVITVLPETTIDGPSGSTAPEHALSEGALPDSLGEISVTQGETEQIVPRGDVAASQEQGGLSGATWNEHRIDALSRSETVVLGNEKVPAPPPIDTAADIPDTNISASQEMEEGPEVTFSAVESSTVEATDLRNTKAPLSQSVETDSQEATVANRSDSDDSSTSGPGLGETSQPWLQPGFSWEAMFNRAWNFGNQESGNTVSPERSSSENDGPAAETPGGLTSQDLPPGSQSEENHETGPPFTFRDATSTGTRIAPMPWDQVQESAVSIPPAEVDSHIEDTSGLTVAQSDDTHDTDKASIAEEFADKAVVPPSASHEPESFSILQDSESVQSPDSPDHVDNDRAAAVVGAIQSSIETQLEAASQKEESFSILQDSEVSQPQDSSCSLEADSAVVDVRQPFRLIEEEPVSMGKEQQDSLPVSLVEEELSVSEAPVGDAAEPLSAEEPLGEERTTAQDEIQLESSDSVLRIEEECTPVGSQLPAQEDSIEPPWQAPQHFQEVFSETMQMEPKLLQPEPGVPSTPPVGLEMRERSSLDNQAATKEIVEPRTPIRQPVAHQEEWQDAGASIRFVEEPKAAPLPPVFPIPAETHETNRSFSSAATAVDVLFESSTDSKKTETRQPPAETASNRKVGSIFSLIRTGLVGFVRACFSTTRSIVTTAIGFMVVSALVVALAIGAIALTWVIMEEPPSQTFQSFTTIPQQTLSDSKKNGYLFLLGIDAAEGQDPEQGSGAPSSNMNGGQAALTCFGNPVSGTGARPHASADVMRKWFRGRDPIGQFKSQQGTIKGWGNEHQLMLDRYGRWQKLPFEDRGYGKPVSLPCGTVAFAHQLHVADGFGQNMDQGVSRLETDMEAWRIALSQARTLPMKMLALQAINDDIAVASGLLVRSDFDGTHLGRLTKLLRPLDQGELSIRWPMQSELVTASKTYDEQLKTARAEAQTASTTVASLLPLPKQRRLNDYAKYYEASYKAAGEGQYGSLPKWKSYIQFPAATFMDYFTNPIENMVGLKPLPRWDEYNGLVVDTDAHLRLASLQAWLRRGPADGDLLARLAKAGQSFYDPYTGLPMLVNMKKGVLYSVGHDGKDQDGDPEFDVVAEIPVGHAGPAATKSAPRSSRAK
ncbi:MAG: hypothetical protein CV089_12715 [Nitrospira sp. WS110]|nr:hypothetical protein [Nitrospira sp. WS110]